MSLATLVAFAGSGPTQPYGGVMADASGDLYGTTIQGPGGSGLGTVFEVPAKGGSVKTLATFNGINGESPQCSPIADAAGNLYGTASFGGIANFKPGSNDGAGDVFEVPAGGGAVKILASFNGANGGWPQCTLVADAAGNLYGAAIDGGVGFNGTELTGDGTVFKVPAGGGSIKTLASFNGSNGSHPNDRLIFDAAGNLYGTTEAGGGNGDGTVFEVPAGGGSVKTLVTFSGSNGSNPSSGLIADAAGNLYGTTAAGGSKGDGTVFEVPAGGGTLKTLATFNGSNGSAPGGGLIADAGANLYGTTWNGNSNGTVFEVPAGSGSVKTLVSFTGLNGSGPDGPLIADNAGTLYGTTWYGGPGYKPPYVGGDGTVFKVSGTGFIVLKVSAPAAQSTTAGISHAFALGSLVQGNAVAPFKDTINWGDGSASTVLTLSSAGTIPATAHKYTKAGAFWVSEIVVDAKGASSKAAKFKVAVSPAAAAKLAFAATPVSTTAGKVVSAFKVKVEDAYGNIVTSNTSAVTLSLSSYPSGATLGGTKTVNAAAGIATFSNVVLTKAGSYKLKAADGSLTAATSGAFTISPAAAAKLAFVSVPASVTHGAVFTVKVAVDDAYGNIVSSDKSTIVLSLFSEPTGGILSGTLSVADASGISSFSNLALNKAGKYVLKATDGKLTAAISASITV